MPKAGSSLSYDLTRQMISPSGFSYTAYDRLYAWYKFDETLTSTDELTDYSNNSRGIGPKSDYSYLTPGAPTSDSPFLKSFDRKSINFNNDLLVNDNDSDFVLSEGFTVSTWIKVDAFSGTHAVLYQGIAAGQPETAGEFSFLLKVGKGIYSDPTVDFYIGDASNSGEIYIGSEYINPAVFGVDKWVHITASYDGGDSPNSLSVYLNGKELAIRSRGETSFTSMNGPSGGRFCVGNAYGASPSYDFDGSIAEVAFWSKVLNSFEVYGIYSLSKGAFLPTSGICTNPVRTIIRENDYRTGSYPTNARTGDPDFTGRRFVEPFDDRNTLDFKTGYPRAKIEIKKGILRLESYLFGITGSNGVKKDYEIVRSISEPESGKIKYVQRNLNATPVKVRDFPKNRISEAFGINYKYPEMVAFCLAATINSDKEIGIKAYSQKNVVYLQQIKGDNNVGSEGEIAVGTSKSTKKVLSSEVTVKRFESDTVTVNPATRLNLNSPFFTKDVSFPNSVPDLAVPGSIIPGVSDSGIHFSPGENISPFDDGKYSIGEGLYYEEGTSIDIVPGFTAPLKSKTQIVINLSSSNGPNGTGTALHFSTGTLYPYNTVNGLGAFEEASGPAGTYHPEIAGVTGSAGFSYWNFEKNRWENRKSIRHPSLKDSYWSNIKYTDFDVCSPLHPTTSPRLFSYRGFTAPIYPQPQDNTGYGENSGIPSTSYVASSAGASTSTEEGNTQILSFIKSAAQPTNSCMFPLGLQYQPSGSQYISMKKYISSPVVVEKIKVDIEGQFGISSNQGKEHTAFRKFFILCQTNDPSGKVPESSVEIPVDELSVDYSAASLREGKSVGHREILTYGRIGIVHEDTYWKKYKTGTTVDNPIFSDFRDSFDALLEFNDDEQAQYGLTSSFSLEIEPRVARAQPNSAGFFMTFSEDLYVNLDVLQNHHLFDQEHWHYSVDKNPGGHTLSGRPSGRALANQIIGSVPVDFSHHETIIRRANYLKIQNEPDAGLGSDPSSATFFAKDKYYDTAPYVIFPEDKLIIGWENIPEFYSYLTEYTENAEEMVDRIKNVKITLYGSQVVNGIEHHDTLNQPLNSDGIHEAILGDPVVDKWDVEPLVTMTGSLYDTHVEGFMTAIHQPSGSVRGSIGSRTKIFQGSRIRDTAVKITTSSFSRTVPLVDNNVVYYDSSTPNIGSFLTNILPKGTLAGRSTIGSVTRYGLTLSTAAGEPTRHIAPFLGLFNDPDINASRNRIIPSNPFLYQGRTVFTKAPDGSNRRFQNLIFENRILSGSFQRIKGISVGEGPERQNRSSYTSLRPFNFPLPVTRFVGPYNASEGQSFIQLYKRYVRSLSVREARTLYNIFYGIPKYLSDGSIRFPVRNLGNYGVTDNIEGFKYGLMNTTPASPVYHFSRTSHGNFRDLYYSPPEGSMAGIFGQVDVDNYDGIRKAGSDETTSPIQIRFVSRIGEPDVDPRSTNCQNLSNISSSSFPYFDGISKDRDAVKNPPPDGDLEGYTIIVED